MPDTIAKEAATPRSARLDVRMPPQNRQLVEQAARLEGVSLTQFAEAALTERAQEIVDAHEKTRLSARDMARFLALLDEDAAPTPALLRGIERYPRNPAR